MPTIKQSLEIAGEVLVQNFHVTRIYRGHYGRVERGSVVLPLLGRKRARVSDFPGWLVRLEHVRRRSLQARIAAGQLSRSEAVRAIRCRPAFAEVVPALHICGRDLCPHCWARRAAWTWRDVDSALFAVPPDRKRRRPKFEFDLVLANRTFRPPDLKPYAVNNKIDLTAVFKDRASDRKKGVQGPIPARGYEMKRLEFLGALDRLGIEPRWKPPVGWKVSLKQVFVVSPGVEVAIPGSTQRRFEKPNRKRVASAISWFYRYPRGFLIANSRTADTRPNEVYLAARQGRRLSAGYGLFRQATKRS
jgi:hypothetical protein